MFFGADKLPEIARGLGKGMRQVRDTTNDIKREINESVSKHGSNYISSCIKYESILGQSFPNNKISRVFMCERVKPFQFPKNIVTLNNGSISVQPKAFVFFLGAFSTRRKLTKAIAARTTAHMIESKFSCSIDKQSRGSSAAVRTFFQ